VADVSVVGTMHGRVTMALEVGVGARNWWGYERWSW